MPFYSTAPSSEFVPRAREAAEHALRLNPDLAEAHATLAYALTVYYWEWEAAEEAFARAIALNPDYPLAHKWHSDLLRTLGRYDESLQAVERAVALDPRSPNARTVLGLTRWCRGEGEDTALAELDRALELDPTYPLTLMHASWLHWMRGDTAAFFRARERLEAVSERGEVAVAQLRRAYAAGGADSVMRLEATAPALDPHPLDRARWHALLGDLDAAFADLEEAVSERVVWLPFGLQYPDLARLADDPRYRAILERMGLY
jgi:tetratricopeptide (TPR) repeat protein